MWMLALREMWIHDEVPLGMSLRFQVAQCHGKSICRHQWHSQAWKQSIWRQVQLHKKLCGQTPRPTVLYEDNKAAILFADHPGDHRRSKHIDTRKYYVRDAVLNGDVQLVYVPTTKQISDGLTKPLSSTLHQTLCVNNLLLRYDMK
jgi:hypothetical protein